jgi:GTP-binding protein EngB required for normal cell division
MEILYNTKSLPNIQSDFETLSEIAAGINANSVHVEITELSEKLSTNRFYLVIIGLFKRGKSSVINALLGQELAPVAVTPVTSVITFFEYSTSSSAHVFFENGIKTLIELSDVVNYVSEEQNPKNKKNVKFLKIYCDNPILKNLIIVDTPGIGSLFEHNTETTIEFLPRIDAALFILSADLPISKADLEFLLQVKTTIPKVLFVLNKSDLLIPSELDKIISYDLKMLNEINGYHVPVTELITVSAREFFKNRNQVGLNVKDPGNFKLLQKKINEEIVGIRDEILVKNSINRLHSIARQLLAMVKVKIDTLQLPVSELEKKRESMQSSIDFAISGKGDFEAVVNSRIQKLQVAISEKTEQKRNELIKYCNEVLVENSKQSWNRIKEIDTNTFNNELSKYILSQYDELRSLLEISVKDEFNQIILQYSRQSQSFLNEIARRMNELLGIDINGIISVFDLDVYTSFYLISDIKFSIPSLKKRFIYKVIPDVFLKRIILSQIHANCIDLINPNAGRIRYDIDYRVSESFRKFKHHFDQKLLELLQSLKSIIEESILAKSTIQDNIESTILQLNDQQKTLDEIIRRQLTYENR